LGGFQKFFQRIKATCASHARTQSPREKRPADAAPVAQQAVFTRHV
jgi:hypothetical protein